MVDTSKSKYRWYVLILAALTLTFCMAVPRYCMPVLFKEISTSLGLNLVQIGWVWGIFPLSGLLTVFLSGLLADRYGARPIMIFACLMAGLSGASRGMSNNFVSLILTTFAFGLFIGVIATNIFKVAASWFPSHQMGLANSILTTGMGVGFTVSSMISATILSPLLGGWRGVLFLYGAISVFIALLWVITVKEQHHDNASGAINGAAPHEAIYHVLHNKNVWLISLAMLGFMGCTEGMSGYLPLYLREFKGWLPASADGTLATFTGVSTLGAIPLAMLSDKIGLRKPVIIPILIVTIIGVGLLSVADGIMIWIIMILIGIGRDCFMAMSAVTTIESKGIGALYTGTAMGLVQTISRTGPFISPPVGNSMAAIGAGFPFLVWSVFGALALVCYTLTKETGPLSQP